MKEDTWETVQIRTFVNWVNSKLEKGEKRYKQEKEKGNYVFNKVKNFPDDLRDGTTLFALIYSLTGSIFKYNKKPTLIVHKRDNIEKVITYLRDNNVEMVNIGAADIQEGSVKLTLALIWRFIIGFSLKEIREEVGGDLNLREKLLAWCRRKTEEYSKVSINDFSESWKDGLAISALVHSEIGGYIYDKGSPIDLATNAIALAKEKIDVPALITAEDMVSGRCDDKSLMTYLLGLYTVSKKNEQRAKKERKDRIVTQIEKNVNYLFDRRKTISDLAENEYVSLEKAKKALDTVYFQVRMWEKEKVTLAIDYILQVDMLNRISNPYTKYIQDKISADSVRMKVSGIFDSSALLDTLSRWGVQEKQTNQNNQMNDNSVVSMCIKRLLTLPQTITFQGALNVINEVYKMAEQEKSKKVSAFGEVKYETLEIEAAEKQNLCAIMQETREGAKRFEEAFAEEIKRERETKETYNADDIPVYAGLSIPEPSEEDINVFRNFERYACVVAEGLIYKKEGVSFSFTPISLSTKK